MARDSTLTERVETVLYTAGVHNSGEITVAIMREVNEELEQRENARFHAREASSRRFIMVVMTLYLAVVILLFY